MGSGFDRAPALTLTLCVLLLAGCQSGADTPAQRENERGGTLESSDDAGSSGVSGTGSTRGAGQAARDATGGETVIDDGSEAQARDAASLGSDDPSDAGAGSDTGGELGDAGDAAEAAAAADTTGVPTIVAVGYAGLRVTSYDLARSWVNKQTLSNVAADDPDNLRGVTFGNGVFVAVGHKVFTSSDGEQWQPREHPQSGQWLGDVKYGNGRFVATGGYGYSAWSSDGINWNPGGSLETEASRSLAFGNGTFISQTDPGNWYRSRDGESWSLDSSGHDGHVAFCDGAFHDAVDCPELAFEGTIVRDGGWNSGVIAWSDDGQSFHDVEVGYVGGINAFAFGYVAR